MTSRKRFLCFLAVAASVCALKPLHAQAPQKRYPSHLPYSFSNFVWWTDDELRALLKKRIPGLGDEVATTTEAEGRIRNALTQLLKEKGITAEVQSQEPGPLTFQPPPANLLLNVDPDELPPPPKPSVVFLVFRPEVRIGKVTVQANTDEARQAVEQEMKGAEGKTFDIVGMGYSRFQTERALRHRGYFDAQVIIRPSAPYKSGDSYSIDETIDVDPGAKYRIRSITADGGPLLQGRDLSQFFTARSGDLAGHSPFDRIGLQLRAFYGQYGYADAQVQTTTSPDREHATVSYALHVIPGPAYHMGSLTIHNLTGEQEKRVREMFAMTPGDLYQDKAINDLYWAVRSEPMLKGLSFTFSPKRDIAAATIELTLDFEPEGGNATVTIQ